MPRAAGARGEQRAFDARNGICCPVFLRVLRAFVRETRRFGAGFDQLRAGHNRRN